MAIERADELALLDPVHYQRHGYPFAAWDRLRKEDPVHHVTLDDGQSFWAVTRYEDIVNIQSQPEIFENGPKLAFGSPSQGSVRMIINMDPPDHRSYRELVNKRFMPRNIEWVKAYVDEIISTTLDDAMQHNGQPINLMDIAAAVPTAVICSYLGVPKHLWPKVLEWTDRIAGAFDPEFAGDQDPITVARQAMAEMTAVYAGLFEERKTNPRDDLLTDLIQARVNGQPIPPMELFSFCHILNTAGHETTKNTAGGGLYALATHPEQLARLQAQPELVPRAIEEILRWVSPAIHFCRTPNRDVEVGGKQIRRGETLVNFYPAANRDPEIFPEPYRFDIERTPNRHLAFGVGAHQCLGMHLARLELRTLFTHLLPRLESIEILGEPEPIRSAIVGGIKRLPVRLTIRPKAAPATV